jgi:uridine kinase
MNTHLLYTHIERCISAFKKPVIIGINGAITSGKTVFSQGLDQCFRDSGHHTQIIHIDDFHNPKSIRLRDRDPQCYFEHAIDSKKFGTLISEIKHGPINKTMAVIDLGTDMFTNEKTYATGFDTIVIVEGVLLYRPEMAHLFDYKIFLDIDYEEVLHRGKKRDVPLYGQAIIQQYLDIYIPVQKIYEARCTPRQQSHLVINNGNVRDPVIVQKMKSGPNLRGQSENC